MYLFIYLITMNCNTAAKADGVVKDLSVDYTEVENPEKDPQSTGETNYNSTSHEFDPIQARETNNTRLHPGSHASSYNPDR